MLNNITLQNKGRIFVLLSNKIPLNKQELMNMIEITDKEMFRRFMKELEDNNIIKRLYKQNKENVYFYFTDEFLNSIEFTLNIKYRFNFVYRLYKNNEIIYVGKTINLSNRINNHKKDKDFDYYDYTIVSDSETHIYEVYYINKYKPILNKDCKGVVDLTLKIKELEFIKRD